MEDSNCKLKINDYWVSDFYRFEQGACRIINSRQQCFVPEMVDIVVEFTNCLERISNGIAKLYPIYALYLDTDLTER